MRWIALALLAACAGPTEPRRDRDPPGPEPGTTCALDPDRPLIAHCQVILDEPAPVELRLVSTTGVARVFRSPEAATTHDLVAWGLEADTEWTWTHGDERGTLTTGSLPPELAGVTVEVQGELFGMDAALQVLQCATSWFVMFDERGRIVWFEPTEVYTNATNGYDWSQADRSLMVQSPRRFQEVSVSGAIVRELTGGTDYDGNLHHDNTRWGPYTYTLYDAPVGARRVDGFHVWEGSTRIASFWLADHYEITDGGLGDWAHANGLNATDDGVLVMSLRNFDRVLAIDGDPASPDFLQILWTAEGTGLGPADYLAPVGPDEGWQMQHNASLDGDRLWLFDNHGDGERSRAARYVLDPATGEARHDRSWWLEEDCPIQGGAVPVEGGVLASCATSGRLSLFREEAAEPSWQLAARCPPGGFATSITRGIPVFVE